MSDEPVQIQRPPPREKKDANTSALMRRIVGSSRSKRKMDPHGQTDSCDPSRSPSTRVHSPGYLSSSAPSAARLPSRGKQVPGMLMLTSGNPWDGGQSSPPSP